MNQRIIYQTDDGGVAVIIPAPEAIELYGIDAIAQKDVPDGIPYLIVQESDIPTDRTFRDAWEADFSNPHGYGMGAKAWFAEQTAKEQA